MYLAAITSNQTATAPPPATTTTTSSTSTSLQQQASLMAASTSSPMPGSGGAGQQLIAEPSAPVTRSTTTAANVVRFVLEEALRDGVAGGGSDTTRYEAVLPVAALKVHSTMNNVISTAGRIAGRCKRHKRILAR